ncbi:phage killer protein [Streptomyces sp. Root431]|uniref:type II toxin-antitoxin system death-on-curing family toxin n=1 Tax=Streptomyces TaxID=1883 RepID=UPI0006F76FFE|nr:MULTISPECIES: type II toxin-antitoxin system death-on-curing family toxin [unclassified Streptomyces]KQX17269.1 phage killer protein [Streptomyces sp. Root431]RSS50820.1 type II toxin-antitoxin system death-on-curing family toxin [Streptomyces sp. WAC01280]
MKYLTVQEVLELADFACAGQQIAVRDLGLLSSAVHRPQSQMFGVEAYSDLFEKAAALLQSLAVNHPLVDGNKRMAWMCTVVFLDFNGTEMVGVDQDEAYKLVIDVATGDLEDVVLIARRLRGLHEAA